MDEVIAWIKDHLPVTLLSCLLLGALGAGLVGYVWQLEQARRYHAELTRLELQSAVRQSELEGNVAELRSTLGSAGQVVERISGTLEEAGGGIEEAIRIIRQLYQQVKELEAILLYRPSIGSGSRRGLGSASTSPAS